jgi:hypothetical protein
MKCIFVASLYSLLNSRVLPHVLESSEIFDWDRFVRSKVLLLHYDRDVYLEMLAEIDIVLADVRTEVLSYSNLILNSSIASIVIRKPSRMLLKIMTRHSSFSFLVNPSLV